MKVLCLDANFQFSPIKIIEGQVYHVFDIMQYNGKDFYKLFEDELVQHWYRSTHFIPVSEIDEIKVYNDRFTEEGLW